MFLIRNGIFFGLWTFWIEVKDIREPVGIGGDTKDNMLLAPTQPHTDEVDHQVIRKIGKCQFQWEGKGNKDIGSFQSLGGIDCRQEQLVMIHGLVVAIDNIILLLEELAETAKVAHAVEENKTNKWKGELEM